MSMNQNRAIINYYNILGQKAIFPRNIKAFLRAFIFGGKNIVIVSNNKVVRGIAKLRGLRRTSVDKVSERSEQFFAFKDALTLLSKKGVPVYFYNRVGLKKDNFSYASSAQRRMREKISFPVAYDNQDLYEDDLREIFGEKYSKAYVDEIGKIPQVVRKGDTYCHQDQSSKLVNVVNGKRVTAYQPSKYSRTVHVYGRCGAFGYAVEDRDTFPSQLQKLLVEEDHCDIRVVNHGLWGGIDEYLDYNFLQDSVGFKEGDIVLFYRKHFDKNIMAEFERLGMWYKDITDDYHNHNIAKYCFFDKPGHMNFLGYHLVAQIICDDLIRHNFDCRETKSVITDNFKADCLNDYLKTRQNEDFENEIKNYTEDILTRYPKSSEIVNCGAIVMNCNPFTYGHRYLIEYAAKQVDRLYIFVVEEDKSFFKYDDRFEMVKLGVRDLENVVVVSSGKFIISSYTFPEYFMKDYVKEKNFDVSGDVEIFCKYIAPSLNISIRFAGEEPFDPVTNNYNENMRRILPEYGIEFCEIPRLALDSGSVISATEVRNLLKAKDFIQIAKFVPDSTLNILKKRYANI